MSLVKFIAGWALIAGTVTIGVFLCAIPRGLTHAGHVVVIEAGIAFVFLALGLLVRIIDGVIVDED